MTLVIDPSKPNISRVYDYILGGNHNFETDRAMAQQILSLVPSYPVWARLNRWYLQLIAQQWLGAGVRNVLDLASGMPTQDHLHLVMPDARVLYIDNDPVTVAYGQEVIGVNPRVTYIEGDIRTMSPILAAADAHFGGDRLAAIGCFGIVYLQSDDVVAPMIRALHDWAAPGSSLALSFASTSVAPAMLEVAMTAFRRLGMAPTTRSIDELTRLVAPWRVSAVRPLSEWIGVERQIDPNDITTTAVEMYGAILEREG